TLPSRTPPVCGSPGRCRTRPAHLCRTAPILPTSAGFSRPDLLALLLILLRGHDLIGDLLAVHPVERRVPAHHLDVRPRPALLDHPVVPVADSETLHVLLRHVLDRGMEHVGRLLRHFTGRNHGAERGDRRERRTIRHRRRLHLHLTPRPQTNVQGRGREGREILHHDLLTPPTTQTSGSDASAPTHEVNGLVMRVRAPRPVMATVHWPTPSLPVWPRLICSVPRPWEASSGFGSPARGLSYQRKSPMARLPTASGSARSIIRSTSGRYRPLTGCRCTCTWKFSVHDSPIFGAFGEPLSSYVAASVVIGGAVGSTAVIRRIGCHVGSPSATAGRRMSTPYS